MTVHLSPELENDVQRLARERGRDIDAIVDEAVRQYVVASAITDVSSEEVGQTQEFLAGELNIEPWEGEENRATR